MFDDFPGLLSDYWTQRRQSIDPELFEPLANHQQNLDAGRLSSNPARIASGMLNANVGKIRAGMINARMGLDVLPQMLAQYQAQAPQSGLQASQMGLMQMGLMPQLGNPLMQQYQPYQMPKGLLR